jgi:hypothetical protein
MKAGEPRALRDAQRRGAGCIGRAGEEIHQRETEVSGPRGTGEQAPQDIQGDIQQVRDELQEKTSIIRNHYDELREELLSLAARQFFNEQRYRELRQRWGQVFRAGMGAEAIYELLQGLDLETLAEELWHEVRFGRSAQRRKKATRQLRVVEALRKSKNAAEWMVLTVLPVLPPELRPWYSSMAGALPHRTSTISIGGSSTATTASSASWNWARRK